VRSCSSPLDDYAYKSRPSCKRKVTDAQLKAKIARVHEENLSVYGVEKPRRELAPGHRLRA
jgi:hypothetical protein